MPVPENTLSLDSALVVIPQQRGRPQLGTTTGEVWEHSVDNLTPYTLHRVRLEFSGELLLTVSSYTFYLSNYFYFVQDSLPVIVSINKEQLVITEV